METGDLRSSLRSQTLVSSVRLLFYEIHRIILSWLRLLQIEVLSYSLIQIVSPFYREFSTSIRYASFSANVQLSKRFQVRWFCFLDKYSGMFPETLESLKHLDRNHMSDESYDGKECGSRTSFMSENLNFDFDLHDKLVKQDSLLRARLYIFNTHSLIGFDDVTFKRSSKERSKTMNKLRYNFLILNIKPT